MQMSIGNHHKQITFGVTSLGKSDLFIGHDWLKLHNPTINWEKGVMELDRCPTHCRTNDNAMEENDEDDEININHVKLDAGDRLFAYDLLAYLEIRTIAQGLAEMANKSKKEQTFMERVPSPYHDFKDIFDKDDFDKLPDRRPWDHAIEITPDFQPVDCKVYPLNLDEQKKLDDFLKENLTSGRIRPSKSPMASPFFFIKKKDGSL